MQPSVHLKAQQPMGSEALKIEVEELRKALAEKEELLAVAAKSEADAAAAAPAAQGEQKLSKKDLKKQAAKAAKEAKKGEQEQGAAIKFDPEVFGPLPLIRSEKQSGTVWTDVNSISSAMEGKTVTVRARISTSRKASAKLAFIVLRKKLSTIQCVLAEAKGASRDMIKWVCSLPIECIVDVVGEVVKPVDPVQSCTQSDAEIQVSKVFLVSTSAPVLPFQVADAAGLNETVNVNQDTRLTTRWLDMRTPANHSIWNLQSKICMYFRNYLLQQRFVEIHSPKIIPAASESGASVFKLGYFDRTAYLAQSPQLYKQMALQGDLERVFEIGPVFRAEDSNTHRHLCEFVGLDVEMEIKEHYYEILDLAEGLFTYIFDHLRSECAPFIDAVQKQWKQTPFEHKMTRETIDKYEIGILNGEGARESKDEFGAFIHNLETATLRMEYPKAIKLLNTVIEPKMEETDDLSTTNEKILGAEVKKRYGVDFFIVDWFPAHVRPFYTMPHPKDPRFSNSYDMFMRGEEISSGAQRVHDVPLLEEKVAAKGVDPAQLKDYINSFGLGAWPHGGFGIGMERVLMLYLGLGNIRSCSLFPRDPQRNTP